VTAAAATPRAARLENCLRASLAPVELEIVDDSHLHAGHVGAADGRGHFSVRIVSERFAGLPVVRRHRLVYEAVGDMMATDIHALSISAQAPGETSPG
jgi:BolA family transcriptional regulator, general stress-responsive regulator